MQETSENQKEGPKTNEVVSRELEMLAFWKARDIFKRSVEKDAPEGDFVFYEGPPTANGHPGIHHLEARAFKDAIPRYKTMRGFRVKRRAGWDTHGLPVELQVEKQLGFSGKKDIESYGIAKFNAKCRESVLQYIDEWQQFTDRIGYWVDQENAYFTYNPSYIESLWNIVKRVQDRSLLYKDYKVVPWCSRCGTALSSHELAQGYEDVKDLSVTAKFKVKSGQKIRGFETNDKTYILAWTTTPWTLPGNIALAVGENVEYEIHEREGEFLILASKLKDTLGLAGDPVVGGLLFGKYLIGLEYEPLYPYIKALAQGDEKKKFEKAFQIYEAPFVTTEDGTGIVHTAVMYGQDDFELGTKVGLPKVHTVGADGKFVSGLDFLSGRFVRDEDVAVDIIKDLASRGLLFSKAKYEHSYPFCWRCKTPLIYYARDSWYIRMSELKDALVSENKKVHWEPEHIQEGRFGEWLSGIKDWAISRERYWGTPLPIWENKEGTERVVIGSLDELKSRTQKSGNAYLVIRHGEAMHNATAVISSVATEPYSLTEKGKAEVFASAEALKKRGITKIIASPFVRARETAGIICKTLGLPESALTFDDRLSEINLTTLSGMSVGTYYVQAPTYEDRFRWKPEGGETLADVKRRAGALLYELESTAKNETILFVTHEYVAWMLQAVVKGLNEKETVLLRGTHDDFPRTGEVADLPFVPLPHNDDFELDLHRPYIDDVVLLSDSGSELKRIPEVMDVWFDSGAMPFAQDHYPFENKEELEKRGYPADFISEAIDQTRGWFYTLLAVGVLMERGAPYNNVICLGHLLDEHGQKMSKSKGNVVDPWKMIEKYGVDILRFWMYTVNAPGDSKNFDERTVDDLQKKVIGRLHNSLLFYETYASPEEWEGPATTHVLDRWIVARLNQVQKEMTEALDAFALDRGTRPIIVFIEDLSTWYIRRSRDRFRGDDVADKNDATRTTRFVFRELAKLLAPFMPFYADFLWQRMRSGNDVESVHLAEWPETSLYDQDLLDAMSFVRSLVSKGLMERASAGIKVRQPLQKLMIVGYDHAVSAHWNELVPLVREELNVKEIVLDSSVSDVRLDTTITPELKEEGDVRDFLRTVQDMRKENGLTPGEYVSLIVGSKEQGHVFVRKYEEYLKKALFLNTISYQEEEGETLRLGDFRFALRLLK